MEAIKKIAKQESAALIAFIAAAVSCLFVPVTNYINYIDTEIIGILFGLMTVVAGFSENNVFKLLSRKTVRLAGDTRRLAFFLVMTVFFLSMLITNDVALIAFVPFTLMLYEKLEHSPVYVIVLQTIAANMGSAFTPVGNPQNLFLFSKGEMSLTDFFGITLPVTLISFIMLLMSLLLVKKEKINIDMDNEENISIRNPRYIFLYSILFVLCILAVFDKVEMIYVFASVCVVFAIVQPVVFAKVDYGLLFTFACFFIFVGNIKNIPQINEYISRAVSNHEFESAIISSQIISNVPSAVMLSGFTDNIKALILGTDIGGLGTPIASLASLISLKNYARSENSNTKRFIAIFTLMNFIFLAVLYIYADNMLI